MMTLFVKLTQFCDNTVKKKTFRHFICPVQYCQTKVYELDTEPFNIQMFDRPTLIHSEWTSAGIISTRKHVGFPQNGKEAS